MAKYLKIEVYRENRTINFNKYMQNHTDITIRIHNLKTFITSFKVKTKTFKEGKYLFKFGSYPLFSGTREKGRWYFDKFDKYKKKHLMWALLFDYEDARKCR